VNEVVLDLSALKVDDLRALHLGAQVMHYRADLAAQPRVAAFFAALGRGVDDELARRVRAHDPRGGSISLTFGEPSDGADEPFEDRRLLAEHLNILGGNPRLSVAVRSACTSMSDQLLRVH